MTLDRIFLAFMVAVGVASGVILVYWPEGRNAQVPPYFWVLIAMLIFELAAYARGRGAPGTMATMESRLLGFVLAIVLLVVIPILAGSSGRVF